MRIVRLNFVLCLALALLSCPAVFAQALAAGAPVMEAANGPLAEAPEKIHDFGEMEVGQEYTYGFVVKNVGNAPLEIKKVIKMCGTDVGRYSHMVPPGGQVKIPVSLSPSGCGQDGSKKSVLVLTNDKNSYFVLRVTGHTR